MNPIRQFRCLLTAAALGLAAAAPAAETAKTEPVRVIQTTELKFPVTSETLVLSAGQAQVLISVDADGKLVDWLVLSYTQRAFADAAAHALKEWRYEPARVDGQPVGSRQALTFDFRAAGNVVSTLAIEMYDNFVTSLFGQTVYRQVCTPEQLDQPLQPLKTARPKYAGAAWKGGSATGRVVLDFYVDDTGRPRMPVVVTANEKLFAVAAIEALQEWRFSPPTQAGRPVAVRVQQEFVFAD
jgi:TonB family protein